MSFWEYVICLLQHLYIFAGMVSVAYTVASYFLIYNLFPSRNIPTGPILDLDLWVIVGLDIIFFVDLIIRGTKQIRFPFLQQINNGTIFLWSICFLLLAVSLLIKIVLFIYLTIQGFRVRNKKRTSKS